MIVNTRPKLLSSKLIELSSDLNLNVLNAHLSKIVTTDLKADFQKTKKLLDRIDTYKNLIFTSQASVDIGLKIIKRYTDIDLNFINIFSIGPATKKLLYYKEGINSITPDEASSESLLKLIQSKYPGKNLLFCGDNSNKFLQNNLKESIDEISCYKLKYSDKDLKKITKYHRIILIYNFLTFEFIYKTVDSSFLNEKIIVTASKRIKDKIKILSKNQNLKVFAAKDPSDESMLSLAKSFT
jgi:uroporphyrinogen-III synthase